MSSQLVPQKPSAPRAHPQAPRRRVVSTPPPHQEDRQPRSRSKSAPSVVPASSLVVEASCSMPDLGAKRVSFTEAPEIICFLAIREEPSMEPLGPLLEHGVEEGIMDSGCLGATLPRAEDAPPPPPLPSELPLSRSQGGEQSGLRTLVADSWHRIVVVERLSGDIVITAAKFICAALTAGRSIVQ